MRRIDWKIRNPIGIDNIRRLIDSADADQINQGIHWYPDAHATIADRLAVPGVTMRQAVGVVSALSPLTEWSLNLRQAESLIVRDIDPPKLNYSTVRLARRFLGGYSPDVHYRSIESMKRYPKTASFYRNILDLDSDRHTVTVDSHMASAWFDGGSSYRNNIKITSNLYHAIASDIRTAARERGFIPYQAQAIAWIVHKHDHGRVYESTY